MDATTVVFDTNVLVAELAFPDEPERCVRLAESGAVEAAVSPAILREFSAVLGYDRLPVVTRTPERRAQAVERVAAFARVVEPAVRIEAASDPDDDAVLECAVAAAADCVISDDAHLLGLGGGGRDGRDGRDGRGRFAGFEVLPREAFLARYADGRIGGRTRRDHRNSGANRNPEG